MSHDEPQLSRSERELEVMLKTLKPAEPDVSAAQIAFEAGRRAGRMQLFRWRAAAAILVAALGVSIIAHPAARPVDRFVSVQPAEPREVKSPPELDRQPYADASPSGAETYLNLRQTILQRGIDALPSARSSSGNAPHEDVLRAGSSIDELRGRL